jgi:carbonic anhydrase
LKLLKDGNGRYVAGQSSHPNLTRERRAEMVAGGQQPFATILGCSDSRVPPEIIFDQGLGDIFVVRVAGNVAGPSELASVEYGVGHLHTPLLLVLGHTSCGAVSAAVQNAKLQGHLPLLINQVRPAVAKAKAWTPTASGGELLAKAIKANVWLAMENLLRKSVKVRELVQQGKLLVLGGVYDLESGQVEWLGAHPDQGRLLAVPPKVRVQMKPRHAPALESETAPDTSKAADQDSMIDPAPAPHTAPAVPAHQ